MSISQNEGLQAAGKAATVFDQLQNRDRPHSSGQRQDKPDEKRVSATESGSYVVNLTDEALKRSDDSKAPSTEKPGDATGNGQQGALIESGKSEAGAADGAASGTQESRPAALVKQPEIEGGFKKFGRIDHNVKSAPEEEAERAAAGEPEQSDNEATEAGVTGAEKVAGGLKDPGTIQSKPESTQAGTVAIGSVDKAKEPEVLERTGTVAAPVEKRTTERVEKVDTAEELRKSISVYA